MNKILRKSSRGLKVAVIGGGPGGSLFAMYLLRYAAETKQSPEITIYQQRRFDELGPRGCKGCAGILSLSLLRNLRELELTVPEEIIQGEIEHYTVHSPYGSISMSNPEKKMQIASIYRGGGPQASSYKTQISFDGWLLRQAERLGVRIEYETISRICLGEERTVQFTRSSVNFDLIVLASGINGKTVAFQEVDYTPPKTRRIAQQELHLGAAQVASSLGKSAHAFLIPHSGLIFGTLVPKGPFVNVSVLRGDEQEASVEEFLNYDIVRNILPKNYKNACSCQPMALISPARHYFADGFVAIGDAAVTRLYKDGIGSALLTARQAAYTVAYHGISRKDFAHYYRPICRAINSDNRWGKLLFAINERTKNSRVFILSQQHLIADEQQDASRPQTFTRAAWGMFTGSYSYRSIARIFLQPISLVRLSLTLLWEYFIVRFRRETFHRKLHVGRKKILILGSGFGGTTVLRRLVPALKRNENAEITMVSEENFFLFSPLLHEIATGHIETRHVAYPIRRLRWRKRFNFMQGSVEGIDLKRRRVTTSTGGLDFDYLVIALGSVSNIPESVLLEKGNLFTLKTLNDAILIRNHIISIFEQAVIEKNSRKLRQLLTFMVAGAGYTGVQMVTELRDFIFKTLVKLYTSIDPTYIRIILVEAESKLMPEMDAHFGAYAFKYLQQTKVETRFNSRVTQVWKDKVQINHLEVVPVSTIIWVAGVVANPQVAALNIAKDNLSRVLVNEYLEVPGFPGVYAVGDCAHFKDIRSGKPVQPRAHTGVRQAKVAAINILADIHGRSKKPYHHSNPVQMVSLGSTKAIFCFGKLRLYGLPARLVWLGAYALLVTGIYNRLRITTDWLLTSVFGRDTNFIKF